ncbi:MAG: hypothetical protein FJ087_18180, partial [Deltaproteobacteria bacterium]|nr:hypothetical protein [Deltaproteobacteria bacterium]
MRWTFACLVAAAIMTAHGPAHAWSTQGAEMLSTGENAADVGIGFPQLRGQFHVPLTRDLAVIPQFTFFYGLDTTVPIVGDGFFAAVRYRVFRSGGLDIALQAEPGIIMTYHPRFGLRIQ